MQAYSSQNLPVNLSLPRGALNYRPAVLILLSFLLAAASACGSSSSGSSPSSPPPSSPPAAPAPAAPAPLHLPPLGFTPSVDVKSLFMGQQVSCSGSTSGDGSVSIGYSYQWQVASAPDGSFSNIEGATNSTFTVTQPQAHRFLSCIMTAKDSQGASVASTSSPVVSVENTAPNAFTPQVSESAAVTGDTLTCSAATTDIDGDNITYSYQWLLATAAASSSVSTALSYAPASSTGQSSAGLAVAQIPSATATSIAVTGAMVGSSLICQATATDGLSRGVVAQSTPVPVADSLPNAFVSTVSTLGTLVGDTISCSGSTQSPAGASLSYSYQWLLTASSSLTPQPIMGAVQPTLTVTSAMAHQFLQCLITATDSNGGATTSVSPALTAVEDSAPNSFTSWTSLTSAVVTDNITCSASAIDVDSDTLSYSYQWFFSSTASGSLAPLAGQTYPTLTITPLLARSYLACQATATDGYGGVTVGAMSSVVPVKDSPPLAFTPTAAPSQVVVWDSISCSGATSNLDQDNLAYTYQWFMGDAFIGPFVLLPADTSPLVIIDLTLVHKFLQCQMTASDGYGGITQSNFSNVVTVENTPPAAFNAAVSKTTALVGDAVDCSGSTTDADKDNITYSFQWSVAGSAAGAFSPIAAGAGGTSSSLTLTAAVAHQFIQCQITANDGHGGVTPSSISPVVTIANSAPAAFSASLPSQPSQVGALATCAGSTTDADKDNVSYSYSWSSASSASGPFTLMSGQIAAALTITPALNRQYLQCQITATDGYGGITVTAPSNVLYVANTPPAAFSASVSASLINGGNSTPVLLTGVVVGDTLSCSGTTSDIDLNTVSYSFQWLSSDSQSGIFLPIITETSATLVVTSAVAHSYLQCQITASDNYGGVTVSSPSVVVGINNTPPTAFSATPSLLTAYMGDSVSCNGTTSDIDGDSIVYSYAWYVLASPSSSPQLDRGATAQNFSVTLPVAHLYLQCQITANDLHNGLTVSTMSPVITIGDTPPSSFTAAVDVSSVSVNGVINCSGSTTDVDGDGVTTSSYNWFSSPDGINYSQINAVSSGTFTASAAYAHLFFKCEVVVTDGWGGYTTSAMSPAVSYTNSPPNNFTSSISPSATTVGGVLSCGGTTNDPDGDQLTYSTQWYSSSSSTGPFTTAVSGLTSSSIIVTAALAHQYLICLRTAQDNYGGVTLSLPPSTASQIINSAPVWGPLPTQLVAETQTLTFSVQASDADLDQLTYSCTSCQGGTISPDGIFTITPGYGIASAVNPVVGLPISLLVTDGWGGSTAASMVIDVENTPRPPVLTITSCPSSVPETSGWTVEYSVYDPDNDGVTVTESSSPSHTSSGPGYFTWGGSYTYATPQNPSVAYTTTLTATDGLENITATASCTVVVTQVNAPPNVGNISQAVSFSAQANGSNNNCTQAQVPSLVGVYGEFIDPADCQNYNVILSTAVSINLSVSASEPGTSGSVTSASVLGVSINKSGGNSSWGGAKQATVTASTSQLQLASASWSATNYYISQFYFLKTGNNGTATCSAYCDNNNNTTPGFGTYYHNCATSYYPAGGYNKGCNTVPGYLNGGEFDCWCVNADGEGNTLSTNIGYAYPSSNYSVTGTYQACTDEGCSTASFDFYENGGPL